MKEILTGDRCFNLLTRGIRRWDLPTEYAVWIRTMLNSSHWPSYEIPKLLPTRETNTISVKSITLDLVIGEHIHGHLVVLRSIELGGFELLDTLSAARFHMIRENGRPDYSRRDWGSINIEEIATMERLRSEFGPENQMGQIAVPIVEDCITYNVFPAMMEEDEHDSPYIEVTDDLDTPYGAGQTGGYSLGTSDYSDGFESFGRRVPLEASWLNISLTPTELPRSKWIQSFQVNLSSGRISKIHWG